MNRTFPIALALLATTLTAGVAAAESLTPEDALQLAWKNNPQLQIAANDLERAELLVVSSDGSRVPTWTSNAGYRRGQTTRLSPEGTRITSTDSMTLTTQLGHTFSPGTQLAVFTSLGRTTRDTVELGDLGAAVDTSFGVEVSQPWLRGFGVDIVDASVKQARASKLAAAASQVATANSVANSVLNAYWSLWSAEQSLKIASDSLEVTRAQLAAAEIRLESGVVAPAELTSLRTAIASGEGSVVDAEAAIRRASIHLSNVIGITATTELRAAAAAPPAPNLMSVEQSIELAREQSPELIRLRSSVESAEIQAKVARNNAKVQLDTTASLEATGLGGTVGAAYEDLVGLNSIVGYIGLRLALPLSNRAARADAERAEISVENSRIDVARAELDLAAQLTQLNSDAAAAAHRLELARRTAELARETVEAQTARFDAGKATTLEVTDAIQSLRESEARVVDIQLQIVETQLNVEQLTGTLWTQN